MHMAGAFDWNRRDCLRGPVRAFRDLWGVDPLAGAELDYSGPVSALRLARRFGGYEAWCRHHLTRNGLMPRDVPAPGDLVFLEFRPPFGIVLGLAIDAEVAAAQGAEGVRFHCGDIVGVMTCRS